MISLIAAIGRNNELGKGNDLLWRLPSDQKFFRETTKGHTVIMGRKTFESIGGALPNRRNIVITRDKNYKKDDAEVVNSLDEALDLSKTIHDDEIFIIGGAEIYRQALPFADKLYMTHIDAADKGADAFFPEIIPIVWNEISHEEHERDATHPFPYTFSVYERF
nr:Dihydrofolate reductase [uncultured bacterium]